MKLVVTNAEYMIPVDEIPEVEEKTELHFTRFGTNQYPGGEPRFVYDDSYKIFCHVNEPTTSRWVEPVSNIIKHHKAYDRIITSNIDVLAKCANSTFMPYGTTWLNKSKHHLDAFGSYTENLSSLDKNFSLSMVCGNLSGKSGYDLRREIFSHKDRIKIPTRFYSSTRYPIHGEELLPNDDKIHLFNSMYSVVVESTQETHYFTEKLIDCLITKTIPFYWGCPNISDFFDTSYWINIEDVLVFDYSVDHYAKHKDAIDKNCEIAKKYCQNIFERILMECKL